MNSSVSVSRLNSRLSGLLLAHVTVLLGYVFSKGLYVHPMQVFVLMLGLLFLGFTIRSDQWLAVPTITTQQLLLFGAVLTMFLYFAFDGAIYFQSAQAARHLLLYKYLSVLLLGFYIFNFSKPRLSIGWQIVGHLQRKKFMYLVLCAVLAQLVIIFYSPRPVIDTYWVIQDGAEALLAGNNPYEATFTNPYTPEQCAATYPGRECVNDNCTYLPVVAYLSALVRLVFVDIRLPYIIASLIVSGVIYLVVSTKHSADIAELSALLYLYLPLSLFVLEQSWVEPVILMIMYLAAAAAVFKMSTLLPILLGLLFATKQTTWLLVPFLPQLKQYSLKSLSITVGVFVAVVAPFLLWNYGAFVYDVVIDVAGLRYGFSDLSLNSVVQQYFLLPVAAAVTVTALGLLLLKLIRLRLGVRTFFYSATIFMLTFFLLVRGFANYYHFISGMIVLLITLELIAHSDEATDS